MDSLETEQLDPILNVWHLRLNGNGKTFDAICTVHPETTNQLYVSGAVSLVPRGIPRLLRLGSQWALTQGYVTLRYVHNGRQRIIHLK